LGLGIVSRMGIATPNRQPGSAHCIELNLRAADQLFNTMDPSPFHEKDLDGDAEEFILGWAREFPLAASVRLLVHLREWPKEGDVQSVVTAAVHHHFANRARLNHLEFRHLMRDGRWSLAVGLMFLAACLVAGEALLGHQPGTLANVLRESLTIGGWVAMWRPMEIYLYEWWPLRRRGRFYQKLSQMPVEVRRVTEEA